MKVIFKSACAYLFASNSSNDANAKTANTTNKHVKSKLETFIESRNNDVYNNTNPASTEEITAAVINGNY